MHNRVLKPYECGSIDHVSRRTLLKAAGLSGICWLTPFAQALARSAELTPRGTPAKSLIVLWLEGAASQLETFDPHPGTNIAAGSKARNTSVKGVQLGEKFECLADVMSDVSLVRSITSKEGDHERAIYNIKTGFRPDPTLRHPAIGSVICHELDGADHGIDIPRHVSILPNEFPARGGYLGDQYDAFKIGDPNEPVPDVRSQVSKSRFDQRVRDLKAIGDTEFRRRRIKDLGGGRTLGDHNLDAALRMMSSDQLDAFNVADVPESVKQRYGDTPFGRGCLAAVRLIETGVRCVEVTLPGWDSHVNNHEIQGNLSATLDPAFAALITDLKQRDLLQHTMVVCGGEFGRTPFMNPVGGRDHWPHGFSIALAGGGIQGGRVIGETNAHPAPGDNDVARNVKDPVTVEDIHATILQSFGIEFEQELDTPIGRPMKISEGTVINKLLDSRG